MQGRGLAVEQPVLWLGLAGFSPSQKSSIETALAQSTGPCRWRVSAFSEADGWWLNGAKASLLPDGRLKVIPGIPTERSLKLDLSEVDRPLAFAGPVSVEELEPLCIFDLFSPSSIQAALLQFEHWLRPVRAQFVMGSLLIQRSSEERRGIYHVNHRGTLIAVLDFQEGQAAILPAAHPNEIAQAQWEKRPPGAGQAPESFGRFSTTQLAWAYVCRTDLDMLPARYRRDTIYYRHVPRVPLRWLSDSQLRLLRDLSSKPATLQVLRERSGLPLRQVEHDLACLYYAGSVTTTASNATAPLPAREDKPPSDPRLNSLLHRAHAQTRHGDVTAPASLEQRRMAGW
jgi:hypothetical protein